MFDGSVDTALTLHLGEVRVRLLFRAAIVTYGQQYDLERNARSSARLYEVANKKPSARQRVEALAWVCGLPSKSSFDRPLCPDRR